jgi:hypothetical protein
VGWQPPPLDGPEPSLNYRKWLRLSSVLKNPSPQGRQCRVLLGWMICEAPSIVVLHRKFGGRTSTLVGGKPCPHAEGLHAVSRGETGQIDVWAFIIFNRWSASFLLVPPIPFLPALCLSFPYCEFAIPPPIPDSSFSYHGRKKAGSSNLHALPRTCQVEEEQSCMR